MIKKILKIFLFSTLTVFLLLVIVVAHMVFSYRSWQRDFEKKISPQELVESIDMEEKERLEEKIADVMSSIGDTSVLELSTIEVSSLMLNSFQGNEFLNIEGVYIDPMERGRWDVYFKTDFLEKVSAWVKIKIRKEDRETAEIFVEDVLIGTYSFKSLGLNKLVEEINQALSSALITVGENGFVGRTLENIELLDSEIVIRLEKY